MLDIDLEALQGRSGLKTSRLQLAQFVLLEDLECVRQRDRDWNPSNADAGIGRR